MNPSRRSPWLAPSPGARRGSSSQRVALAIAASIGASCSLLVDAARPQCSTDADCEARGFHGTICVETLCRSAPLPELDSPDARPRSVPALGVDANDDGGVGDVVSSLAPDATTPVLDAGGDPRWACLVHFAPPSVAAGSLVPYRLRFERGREPGVPPAGLSVRLCRREDATCAEPIAGIPAPDASGLLTLELDPSFHGYLEVEATDQVPSLVSLPPLVVWPPEAQIIRMIEPFDLVALLSSADIAYDDARGFAFVLTNDCLDQRAAGVVLSTSAGDDLTVAYYYRDGQPDRAALATDARGAGGFSRLPTGPVSVEARRAETSELIGAAEFESRPGSVSYVPIGPTASP
ncbi:MAG TPA: hypothetical protein VMG12_29990 [Polyangiaceae bacterium]|nr:hypothetical protein [Polyangiaceae bacterium]